MKRTGLWLLALLLVLASLGACANLTSVSRPIERRPPSPTPAAAHPVGGSELAGLSTLEQLDRLLPPQRDLRQLALQLNPDLQSIPPTVVGDPPIYAIGDQEAFWVRNVSTNRVAEISATLVYSTPVAYVWVESGQEFDRGALRQSADRFSSITYPNVVTTFGSEWRPGVDKDPRLHMLFNTAMGDGVAGYFSGADEYTQPVIPFSNQKEMFYINLTALNRSHNFAGLDTTLAHELQHMIHWHMDRGEELWLNEGLSEYAQEVAELSAGVLFAGSFAAAPDLQLTTWDALGNNGPHYGAAYLFVAYLAQRFGRQAITNLVADTDNGMRSVTEALHSAGSTLDAEQLFADWVVANYADQPAALGEVGRFGYITLDLPAFTLAAQHSAYPVEAQQAAVANFASDYIELKGEGDVVFTFQGITETQLAATTLVDDGRAWWSNRADDAAAQLRQQYDLSAIAPGTPLTLTASMWWDIESDYDFGYVMASVDGEHWSILPGQHTADTNHSGNAFGPGYTGASGDSPDGAPAWVDESIDLSSYAGGPLWLDFRYITDDGVTRPGWFVDDVQLIGPDGPIAPISDSPNEGPDGSGWASSGWLFTDNRLPQRWLLQVLEFDGNTLTAVRRVPVNAAGHAEVEIDDLGSGRLGSGRRAVVAISGLSPVTTLPANYEYTVAYTQNN